MTIEQTAAELRWERDRLALALAESIRRRDVNLDNRDQLPGVDAHAAWTEEPGERPETDYARRVADADAIVPVYLALPEATICFALRREIVEDSRLARSERRVDCFDQTVPKEKKFEVLADYTKN